MPRHKHQPKGLFQQTRLISTVTLWFRWDSRIIITMRFSSAFVVLALTGALFGQMTASRAVARKAQTDYTLDDGIGAVALYPGEGYRSYVQAKFLVSSLHDLESRISQLPRGTTLHWLPHKLGTSGNPILFASGEYEQFVRFCSDHEIQLLIQRTYRPHVNADGSYTRTVVAQGDNGITPIEFRSLPVHLASDAGGAKEYILRMLYDPKTTLFYWDSSPMYQGYAPEGEANLSDLGLQTSVIYLASDQMAIFRQPIIGGGLMIDVSTKRQNSLSQGQASAIRALERETATPFRRSKLVTYWKQLPPDFFKQCITDINMPGIQSVQRQTNRWQVTVAAQNGNTATLSLDDSYNLVSTKITLNPNADAVGGCKR
ncbi:MAG TPA: hypothetical protein VJX30_06430 [Terriglobales bacterium]|nr:hypothetical protein [Terriglobales bacterium]